MPKKPDPSREYYLLCGHRKRLKDKTAVKGKIYCWACQKEVGVGDPVAA